jgi:predicted RNA-binding protein with PUA-like domain
MPRKPSAKSVAKPTRAPAKAPARKAPAPIVSTGYWLFKSEPDAFSWSDLVTRGETGEPWEGVRNYLARNNMRAMKIGDLGFFYHSNEGKEIVGICEVSALAHPDPKDATGTWECVDVRAVAAMPRPVTLVSVKANPKLAKMSLVTSMRLSVQPVTRAEWEEVCRMGGLDPKIIAR